MSVINNQITIFLHNQSMSLSSLIPSIRSPGGLIVRVIDDQVTIILHGQSIRSMSLSVGLRRPDSILGVMVIRAVKNEVTIVLHFSIVSVLLGLKSSSWVKGGAMV